MTILGIETSCDDTAISLLKTENERIPEFRVISNLVSSQTEIHRKWGGVYPTLAKREHQKNLPILFKKTLDNGKYSKKKKKENIKEKEMIPSLFSILKEYQKPDIDFISLTIGPGLDPSLWTGVNFAKAISCQWNIPIIPINHIEAHLIISLFSLEGDILKFKAVKKDFPAMGLIVSGGHTQLVLIKKLGKYKIVGETRDDAAGECFDKAARILGLGYPGGPAIANEAEKATSSAKSLPRPMIGQKNHDFSFSGLKTAILYRCQTEPEIINDQKRIRAEAKEIQQAIIDVLISKTLSATKKYKVKSIITGGGVISNKELRNHLIKKTNSAIKIFFPPPEGQTDNALMVSVAGYFNMKKALSYNKIETKPNLRI